MTPHHHSLPPDPDQEQAWLERAVETLAEEHLVVLPTETVYGIAARADSPRALERLAEAKGTPAGRPWTWHVGSAEALERFEGLTASAERLADRYWPGPLTLVLPGVPEGLELTAAEDWTGVRCTAGEVSGALCEAAPFPIVMTSANPHGETPAIEGSGFEQLHLGENDLILGGGTTRLQEASTVLKLGRGHFDLLREGLHDMNSLRKTAGLHIAFACTGNTCRSPMAEGLARTRIAARLECSPDKINEHGFEVSSMGIFAGADSPAASHAIETLRELDIDLSEHRSRQATPERFAALDVVYCLTRGHLAALEQMLPPRYLDRLSLLDPDGRDIDDPIGGSAKVYRDCAEQISECIEARLDEWV